jgi:hypothetical protein
MFPVSRFWFLVSGFWFRRFRFYECEYESNTSHLSPPRRLAVSPFRQRAAQPDVAKAMSDTQASPYRPPSPRSFSESCRTVMEFGGNV